MDRASDGQVVEGQGRATDDQVAIVEGVAKMKPVIDLSSDMSHEADAEHEIVLLKGKELS